MAPGREGIGGFCLANESLGLAALDALGEKLAAEVRGLALCGGDTQHQRSGMARRGLGFNEGGDAVGQIGGRTGALPAAALAGARALQDVLQGVKIGEGGVQRKALLFLFQVADAEQPAEGRRDRHD